MPNKQMKEIEVQDRPRERMRRFGPEQLKQKELLQILLGSGIKGHDVRKIAARVLRMLEEKAHVTYEDLKKIKGLGDAKISLLLATLEFGKRRAGAGNDVTSLNPEQVWEEMFDIRKAKREHFVIVLLNSRDREICREIISIGTLNWSVVHPREVFEPAVKRGAATILGVHNHPSGDVNPSDADLQITRRLVEAGNVLGIDFYDHIIVADTKQGGNGAKYYSIREHHDDLFD